MKREEEEEYVEDKKEEEKTVGRSLRKERKCRDEGKEGRSSGGV